MSQPPVSFSNPRPGLREASLLLVGAGFASLMFDLPTIAIVCGALALGVWGMAMARGPRPSWRVSASLGGGLVLMYMWWPDEADSWAAIGLMWAGVAIVLASLGWGMAATRHTGEHPAH